MLARLAERNCCDSHQIDLNNADFARALRLHYVFSAAEADYVKGECKGKPVANKTMFLDRDYWPCHATP